MSSGASATDQLFERLNAFRADWPKKGWSWDYRFECVASSFHVDLTREAETALLRHLPAIFDHKTLASAPAHIQEVSEEVGGVRADQKIFTGDASGRLAAFGLWWPWGDETTISLRVGLAGYVSEQDLQRLQMEFNAIS